MNFRLQPKNGLPTLFFLTLILIQACQKDNDHTPEIHSENSALPSVVQDTTFTDAELQAVLQEEDSIKVLIETGRIVDISGMVVEKENPKKVYIHYMPWFQSKDYNGYWGQHWTMVNKNPEIIDINGQREIASYYYPIIGPYASDDPDLQEYHMLLMKLAGIDGVIFDWYGSKDVYDYQLIKQATESFMGRLDDLGLSFSIMYEDRVAQASVDQGIHLSTTDAAQDDFNYIKINYFIKDNFFTYDDRKLMFVFGPGTITNATEWDTIFSIFPENEKPHFLTLWAANQNVGANASGEFLWVAPDHLLAHEYYYNTYLNSNFVTVGSCYPGFNSFYEEGGWGLTHDWSIAHNNGNTFVETLNYTHHQAADFIQLATWNDFGEGTMLEPTEEYGFFNLQILQQYTGVTYTPEDLQTTLDLYRSRKLHAGNKKAQYYLDRSYQYIKKSKLKRADLLLQAVNRHF
ncbi:glycoside hydrolase family 71/99-like protein [Zobellia alginiliquefaciens]|uniref:glycoside hydrolase family 71/99-like protein n=1 Tax=Zobellia alginiliquefaciens TaxID=3032586 RepID=UPI0023E3809F|nr:glycoside hydrolase family 71/99-like protein [Zobellia alginiliquefaciens]